MLDMCVLDVLILSKRRNRQHLIMSIVNHTKLSTSQKGIDNIFLKSQQFIVYADFESFTPQLSACQPNPDNSYTKRYEKHNPSGFCYHIKYFHDTLYSQEPVTFVKDHKDDDVAQIFIDTLEKNIKEIYKKFRFPKVMIMTIHDKMTYDNFTLCHICN